MTKKEFVLAAMSGKIQDRMPASFWFHFSGNEADGQGSINAHLEYLKKTDIDFLKIMSDGLSYQPDYGIRIEKASDWRKIKPQGKASKYVKGAVERVKRINEALKGEVATFYTVFSAVSIARHHVLVDYFSPYKKEIVHNGPDDLILKEHLREDPESVLAGLDAIAEDTVTLIHEVVKEGNATGLFISIMSGEIDRFTFDEYHNWVTPSDMKIINGANEVSNYNIAHYCGYTGVKNNLQLWKDYPLNIINWASVTEDLNPVQAREVFGKNKVLLGGFDCSSKSLLVTGTEHDIKAFTEKLMREYANAPFIIGADCTVPPDIDINHIKWVLETTKKPYSRQ
jgi:hypothetical protein